MYVVSTVSREKVSGFFFNNDHHQTRYHMYLQAQSKPFFSGAASSSMAELASSSPVLGMQWAGPGSTEAALSLLAAAGVSVPSSPVTPQPQQQQTIAGGGQSRVRPVELSGLR